MEDNDQYKNLWFRIKLFLKYICTEPFIQAARDIRKIKTWFYIYSVIVVYSIFFGGMLERAAALLMWFFLFLLKEYEKGDFMRKYREDYGRKYSLDKTPPNPKKVKMILQKKQGPSNKSEDKTSLPNHSQRQPDAIDKRNEPEKGEEKTSNQI